MSLRDLREDNDYKQSFIAEYLYINQNTYSQYENEQRQIPLAALIKLADLYNTSIDYIIGITDNPKKN
ncbi:MAG: helix-turn-helix domain-containing protein [Eubacterium sp.]|nr:helix-turn-helix domain-containing protein [Eubacterium sp.]